MSQVENKENQLFMELFAEQRWHASFMSFMRIIFSYNDDVDTFLWKVIIDYNPTSSF